MIFYIFVELQDVVLIFIFIFIFLRQSLALMPRLGALRPPARSRLRPAAVHVDIASSDAGRHDQEHASRTGGMEPEITGISSPV